MQSRKMLGFLGLFVLMLSACAMGAPPACTPGATQSCACGGGTMGVQTCNTTGTGFSACGMCSGGVDAGAPDNRASCTNDCAANTAQCVGNGFQTCTRGSDSCFHWSTVTQCTGSNVCQNGACVAPGCTPRCSGTTCAPNSDGCGGMCPCAAGMECATDGTCCTPENGAASCTRFINAWCNRIVMCCTAMGPTACMSWAYSANQCTGHFVSTGFNCASSEWTSRMVCREASQRCANDIPLVSCSDVVAGTANFPPSCN